MQERYWLSYTSGVLVRVWIVSRCLATPIAAQTHVGRPIEALFQTEVIYPQEAGEIQITLATRFEGGRNGTVELAPTLEYGLTDAWEIDCDWQAFVTHDADDSARTEGPGDLSLGTRYTFSHIAATPAFLSFGFELGVPTGDVDRGLGEGLLEYEPFGIAAWDLPVLRPSQVFTQLGVSFAQRVKHADSEEDEPAAHSLFWSSGFFWSLGGLHWSQELTWQTNTWNSGGNENLLYWTPGVIWKRFGTWEVGVAAPVGLTVDSAPYGIIANVTVEFDSD